MIESPLLQKMMAERGHNLILAVLKARFGAVPQDVAEPLRSILDEKKLTSLNVLAAQCPDSRHFVKRSSRKLPAGFIRA